MFIGFSQVFVKFLSCKLAVPSVTIKNYSGYIKVDHAHARSKGCAGASWQVFLLLNRKGVLSYPIFCAEEVRREVLQYYVL
jgi:hypothetical protein